jgi:hypothetical protein
MPWGAPFPPERIFVLSSPTNGSTYRTRIKLKGIVSTIVEQKRIRPSIDRVGLVIFKIFPAIRAKIQ